jgi:hypothetical protein
VLGIDPFLTAAGPRLRPAALELLEDVLHIPPFRIEDLLVWGRGRDKALVNR